ncbi:MAG: rplY [Gammaproteobacteria bacterium]|nr:rplY [Gammaproteobacteria bacterium]
MSTIKFELDAQVRNDIGKGASRRLRHANKVPAVIYGAGEPAVSLTLHHDDVFTALSNEAFYSRILTLSIEGKKEKVILKALERHPAKPRIAHMDFLRVRADQKLHMHVPLHFIGAEEAPGVREGGAFSHIINDVEVSCLPANLPEFIEVDLSHFVLDQTMHLSELKLPKGVDLVAFSHGVEGHDLPVVSLHIPRIIEETPVVASEEEETTASESEAAAGRPEDTAEAK